MNLFWITFNPSNKDINLNILTVVILFFKVFREQLGES